MTRAIFITGGSSGLGLCLAKYYLEQGSAVGVCCRNLSKIPADLLAQSRFFAYEVDVREKEKLQAAIKEFDHRSEEGIDLLIANAGISIAHKTAMPDFSLAKEVMDINFFGMLYSFEAAISLFIYRKKRGHLVAISSVAGMVGLPKAASYSASKSAMLTFCESLVMDLEPFGIDVTAVAPGFIDTPLTQKNNHPMPFLISVEQARDEVLWAIKKKRPLHFFPLPMKWLMLVLQRLPRSVYRWIMSWRYLKYLD